MIQPLRFEVPPTGWEDPSMRHNEGRAMKKTSKQTTIPDALHARIRHHSYMLNKPITHLVAEALEDYLNEQEDAYPDCRLPAPPAPAGEKQ